VLSHISITCFAASYLVAWLLEITRLLFRSGVRGALMLGFASAGLVAHSLFLGYRALHAPGPPLSSSYDWYLLAAWMLAVAFLYLAWLYPRSGVGLFLWPLTLGLIVAAAFFADPEPIAPEPASQIWGAAHGIALLLGDVAVMFGFIGGLMYLVQAWRLKRHVLRDGGPRLPSLEWLERVNSRVVFVSAALVSVGFAAGIVLNRVGGRTLMPWTDPVVWSSGLMLAWLLAAAAFNVVYRPARHGRKVAYLTVASFGFLLLSLAVLLGLDTRHGGQKAERQRAAAEEGAR